MENTIPENISVIYRPVEKHEQNEALNLWYSVFGTDNSDCFERDFSIEASPTYQEGDTIGAWVDQQIVSAVHIRRLMLESRDDGRKYLCGGISNVATLPMYRKQGLSRHILRLAIQRMEQSDDFDLSILGTGQYKHYSVLGWEQIRVPKTITIEWKIFDSSMEKMQWYSTVEILSTKKELLHAIHADHPRQYQFDRSPATLFEHLIGWNWQLQRSIIHIHCEKQSGYVVISKLDNIDEIYISEWRAPNLGMEKTLLKIAAEEIYRRQQQKTNIIRFHSLPQYMTIDELEQWAGTIKVDFREDMMIRNIRLPNEIIHQIKSAYSNGCATFWQGDTF